MNLLLLDDTDFASADTATVTGQRLEHCHTILKSRPGDTLAVGRLNGMAGRAIVTGINSQQLQLADITLDQPPPAPLPLTVILALPRPQVLKRVLHNIAEFGIKQLHLIHCHKVEKSYWQSQALQADQILAQLKNGLMQAKDTQLPEIHQHRDFQQFIRHQLPPLLDGRQGWIAHPYGSTAAAIQHHGEQLVAIGPEGGFIDGEVDAFEQCGVRRINIGSRIYRVENALTLLTARLTATAALP